MAIDIQPIGSHFGARIAGVDFSRPIEPGTFEQIQQALTRYAVLGFCTAPIDDEQQLNFSSMFGRLHESILDESRRRLKDRRFNDVGNLNVQGEIDRNEEAKYGDANLLWHSDLSFLSAPAKVTILSARVLPPTPPDTEFADMRAAWAALPAARQAALEGLQVEHSVFAARERSGFTDFTDEERRRAPPVVHPLVRTHPQSGVKTLYLSSSAARIVGWPDDEGRALLDELTAFATQPQFVLAYKWQAGDVLVWDGAATMHRATPFNSREHKRELHWNAVVEPIAA